MITDELYEEILLRPARETADELYVITGYASAPFAAGHLERLIDLGKRPLVRIVVGMFPQIANLLPNHRAFQTLSSTEFPGSFECRYVTEAPPIHVKAYAWFKGGLPFRGFVGSANYTRNGFENIQREAVVPHDPEEIRAYFDTAWVSAIDCRERTADALVETAVLVAQKQPVVAIPTAGRVSPCDGLPQKCLSLLMNNSRVHNTAGLNWGQRSGRSKNEAYIPVPSAIGESGFFPAIGQQFTVITDDDRGLICVTAQPKKRGGNVPHAIQTPLNNSDLGIYFRNRLGLPSGAPVSRADLDRYGRTTVHFCKIDDETYYMDFSMP